MNPLKKYNIKLINFEFDNGEFKNVFYDFSSLTQIFLSEFVNIGKMRYEQSN